MTVPGPVLSTVGAEMFSSLFSDALPTSKAKEPIVVPPSVHAPRRGAVALSEREVLSTIRVLELLQIRHREVLRRLLDDERLARALVRPSGAHPGNEAVDVELLARPLEERQAGIAAAVDVRRVGWILRVSEQVRPREVVDGEDVDREAPGIERDAGGIELRDRDALQRAVDDRHRHGERERDDAGSVRKLRRRDPHDLSNEIQKAG